tara:strand:- start:9304 stop:10059 length:756 start_codon:yes stop_codon:yes gene_type:complete
MNLDELNDKNFSKLDTALKGIFGMDFNFKADTAKLEKIREATTAKIERFRDAGVEVTDKSFQKLLLVKEGLDQELETRKNTVMENELDQAEVLLAAKQMAEDLQKMAETLASMQVEELMAITDKMKEEVGIEQAEAFNASAETALQSALDAVKSTKESMDNAVLTAQGKEVPTDMEMDTTLDAPADPEIPAEPETDDFEGVDAANADEMDGEREMKEDAYLSALKMVKEAQKDGKVSKELLKKAFEELRKA